MKHLPAVLMRPETLIGIWLSWSLLALAWLAYRDAWFGVVCIAQQ